MPYRLAMPYRRVQGSTIYTKQSPLKSPHIHIFLVSLGVHLTVPIRRACTPVKDNFKRPQTRLAGFLGGAYLILEICLNIALDT